MILLGLVGSGPAEIVKRSNWPGSRPPSVATHVIFEIASVTSPSSVCTGFASVVFWVVIVHPGIGWTLTDGIGFLVGMSTSSCTVFASSFSFGTEKLRISKPPFCADDGLTDTCAAAGPPSNARTTNTSATNPIFFIGLLVVANGRRVPSGPEREEATGRRHVEGVGDG